MCIHINIICIWEDSCRERDGCPCSIFRDERRVATTRPDSIRFENTVQYTGHSVTTRNASCFDLCVVEKPVSCTGSSPVVLPLASCPLHPTRQVTNAYGYSREPPTVQETR